MSDNVFDVDKFLDDNSITIKIKGKNFVVADIPFSFNEALKSGDDEKRQKALVDLLGCDEKDLEGYGLAATNAIIDKVTKSLFPKLSQKEA